MPIQPAENFASLFQGLNAKPWNYVTENDWQYYAADEIQNRRAQQPNQELTSGQQLAIQDTYKQLAGMTPTGGREYQNYQEARQMELRNAPIRNLRTAAGGTLAQMGMGFGGAAARATDVLGITEGATGRMAQRSEELGEYYRHAGGVSGFAGEMLGNVLTMLPAMGTGAISAAVPAAFGVSAAGGTFMDVAGRRARGEEISGLQEFTAAGITGISEWLFERYGRKIAMRAGGILGRAAPQLRQAIAKDGAMEGIKAFSRSFLPRMLGTGIEGAFEEAATQIAQNAAAKIYKDQPLTAGVGKAALMGGLLPFAVAPFAAATGGTMGPTEAAPTAPAAPTEALGVEQTIQALAADESVSQEIKTAVGERVQQELEKGTQFDDIDIAAIIDEVEEAEQPAAAEPAEVEEVPVKLSKAAQEGIEQIREVVPETEVVEAESKTDKAVQKFAEDRGVEIVFVDAPKFKGARVGNVVYVKAGQSVDAAWGTVGHEVGAHVKGMDQITDLASKKIMDDYEAKYEKALVASFGEDSRPVKDLRKSKDKRRREGRALLITEVMRRPDVRRKIQNKAPKLYEKIIDIVRAVGDRITGMNTTIDKVVQEFTEGKAAPETKEQAFERGVKAGEERYGYDASSGLPKREIMLEQVEGGEGMVFARADKEGVDLGVVAIDLANFKALNDTRGTKAGNDAKGVVGKAIKDSIRTEQEEGRGDISGYNPGGDEFNVILFNADAKGAQIAMDRIKKKIDSELKKAGFGEVTTKAGKKYSIFAAAGLEMREAGDSRTFDEINHEAELGMKEAKKAEKGEADVYPREQVKELGEKKAAAKPAEKKIAPPKKVAEQKKVPETVAEKPERYEGEVASREATDLFVKSVEKQLTPEERNSLGETGDLVKRVVDSGGKDADAKMRLTAKYMGTLHSLAQQYFHGEPGTQTGGIELEDLQQAAIVGMRKLFGTQVKGKARGKLRIGAWNPNQKVKIKGKMKRLTFQMFISGRDSIVRQEVRDLAFEKAPSRQPVSTEAIAAEAGKAPAELATEETVLELTELKDMTDAEKEARIAADKAEHPEEWKQLGEMLAFAKPKVDAMKGQSQTKINAAIIPELTIEYGMGTEGARMLIEKAQGKEVQFLPMSKEELAKVQQEKPKTTGRPELANPMELEGSRRLMDIVDEQRKKRGEPTTRTISAMKADAKKKLKKASYRLDLTNRMREGRNFETDADVYAAKELLNEKAAKAIKKKDAKSLQEAEELSEGWRKTGTEAARILSARRDEVKSPAERLSEYTLSALTTRPQKIKDKVDQLTEAGKEEQAGEILDAWTQEKLELLEKWEREGIDLDKLDEIAQDSRSKWKIIRDIQNLTTRHGLWAPIQEYYRNVLMAAPLTIERNILGGAFALSDVLAVKPTARMIKAVMGRETKGENVAALSTLLSRRVWARAMNNFATTIWYETPAYELSLRGEAAKHIEIYGPPAITGKLTRRLASKAFGSAIGDKAGEVMKRFGQVIRMPQRINAAVDQMVKTIHAHTEVAAQAIRLGKEQGLRVGTEDMQTFVDEQLNDMDSQAWAEAISTDETNRVTFQAKAGWLEEQIIKTREKIPMTGLLVPFIKTPAQIAKQAGMMTPLGSIYMGYRAVKGGRAYVKSDTAARHAAQQLLAWSATAMVWNAVGSDEEEPRLTGTLSYGPKERAEVRVKKEIAPPMSIRVGDKWVSYRNIEPFSTAIGTAANMAVEAKKFIRSGKKKPAEAFGRMWRKTYSLFADQTYLRAVGDAIKVASGAEEYTARNMATRMAGSWLPNFIDSGMRASDEYIRERRVMGEKGERPSPGEQVMREMWPSETHRPPPKVDFWGRDIKAEAWPGTSLFMSRLFIPFIPREIKTDKTNKVLLMLDKYNQRHPDNQKWFQPPQVSVTLEKGEKPKAETEQMSEQEYHMLNKLSGLLSAQRVEDRDWNYNNPTDRDIRVLADIIEDSRSEARSFITDARRAKNKGNNERYDYIIQRMQERIESVKEKSNANAA